MNGRQSNCAAWLAKAENELLNIENNLAARNIPWDTICFHAQQAAEKLLKGFLVYHGRELIRTHDLIALLAASVQAAPGLAKLQQDRQRLTHYAVASRYPDDLYEPGESDGRDMVAWVGRVRTAIVACLER